VQPGGLVSVTQKLELKHTNLPREQPTHQRFVAAALGWVWVPVKERQQLLELRQLLIVLVEVLLHLSLSLLQFQLLSSFFAHFLGRECLKKNNFYFSRLYHCLQCLGQGLCNTALRLG
jgi:hypothetical protein